MEIRNNHPTLNQSKAKEIILYLLNRLGEIDERKLQCLLYFIDFDFFEKFEEHIMGFTYIKNCSKRNNFFEDNICHITQLK